GGVASAPRPRVAFPWGSQSTRRTRRSRAPRPAPRLMAVVVLPTPPFWLAIARIVVIGPSWPVVSRGGAPEPQDPPPLAPGQPDAPVECQRGRDLGVLSSHPEQETAVVREALRERGEH